MTAQELRKMNAQIASVITGAPPDQRMHILLGALTTAALEIAAQLAEMNEREMAKGMPMKLGCECGHALYDHGAIGPAPCEMCGCQSFKWRVS